MIVLSQSLQLNVNTVFPNEVKDKANHYRHGIFLRFPGILGSENSNYFTHRGDKVVSLTLRPPSPQETFLVLISVRD